MSTHLVILVYDTQIWLTETAPKIAFVVKIRARILTRDCEAVKA